MADKSPRKQTQGKRLSTKEKKAKKNDKLAAKAASAQAELDASKPRKK